MTLIFSLDRYRAVMNAYLEGLEKPTRPATTCRRSLGRLVLRLPRGHRDRQAPRRHRHRHGPRPQGQGGSGQRAPRVPGLRGGLLDTALGLAGRGRRQPAAPAVGLHRSQGPAYPDTMYVTELVTADVVNTMPGATLEATADHGDIHGDTVTGGYELAGNSSTTSKGSASLQRGRRPARDRGRRQVREGLGRAAGRRHGRDGEGDRMSSLSVSASGAAADAIGRHVPTLVEDSVAAGSSPRTPPSGVLTPSPSRGSACRGWVSPARPASRR